MQYLIGVCIGIFLSATFRLIITEIKTFGKFEIDTSADDKDIFRLNWTKDPHKISNHRYIIFDVYNTKLKSLNEEATPDKIAKK